MTRADEAASDAPRGMWLITAGAIALSIALHVVPQLLRDRVDPAWSMLVLMLVDACVVALIMRSRTALLVGVCAGGVARRGGVVASADAGGVAVDRVEPDACERVRRHVARGRNAADRGHC